MKKDFYFLNYIVYYRRYHGDVIMNFNLIHHHFSLESILYLTSSYSYLYHAEDTGSNFTNQAAVATRYICHHVFSHRAINQWNSGNCKC